MKKIKISISVNSIYFSFTNQVNEDNINQTSYIETGNLLFEYEYLTKNYKLMTSFIADIIKQTKIDTLKIKNIELVPITLKIIKNISEIKKLYILDNKSIDTNSFLTIVDNKNINYLNCYNMPNAMFYYLNRRKDILIELRNEINFTSHFTKSNKLNKFSTIFYKKNIVIDADFNETDIKEFEAFLLINKHLQTITIKNYNLNQFKTIYSLLIKLKKEKLKINIYQTNENINQIFNDINTLKKLKNRNFKIKILYDKDYIFKNFFKQINLSLLRSSFLIIFITLMLILVITKYLAIKEENATDKIINDIQNVVEETETLEETNQDGLEEITDQQTDETITTTQKKDDAYLRDYDKVITKLKELNNDTIGWLTVKNTKIDYPVLQSKDNEYYLKRSFDKTKNARGWLFADYRNSFDKLDDNTIIYGHTMKSGHMFGTLKNVLSPDWYNNLDNRTIIFNTENSNNNWLIFSIYTIKKSNDYLVSTFANETNFNNYINLSKERSIIDFGIDIKYGDNILTLSTCYGDSTERLVVQAKLIK